MTELEAHQESRNPLKQKRTRAALELNPRRERSPTGRRGNPAEGRSLGTFNGKTDLDTLLVRFETCSRHFGWSNSERVFHLMNALTDSAEPIVKEVGLTGSLELMLELLQSRFGNKLRLEILHADLPNRKRGRTESLQDLYLDLCRLRALASGEDSDGKFPEKYFRNIFVDAWIDREFRRAVLVQNPGTMEEAYRVATQLEAIDAYETPVSNARVRQIDLGTENLRGFRQNVGPDKNMARRLVEIENEGKSLRADAQRPVGPSVQYPGLKLAGGSSRDDSPASSTHRLNVPKGRGIHGARPDQRNFYNSGSFC